MFLRKFLDRSFVYLSFLFVLLVNKVENVVIAIVFARLNRYSRAVNIQKPSALETRLVA